MICALGRNRWVFDRFSVLIPFQKVAVNSRTRSLYMMPAAKPSQPSPKILMLHGYTQNGELFHAKTRVLEKHLKKVFPDISLSYPTGPLRLDPRDVPGFDASSVSDPDDIEAYGWWRRSDNVDPPEYVGMDQGLEVVAKVIEAEGPFDGVIGFSQGGALAAMVSALLEGDSRKEAFKAAQSKSAIAIPFPASWENLQHPPMKFCVSYSGFIAPGERYTGFYQNPTLQTPLCHFIGSLDSVVIESRTQALVDAAGGEGKTQVVTHPGGHFVPSGRPYLDAVAAFVKQHTTPQEKDNKKEDRVEDMDVPF